jgi:rod shape-determining protein MreC
LTIGDTVVTSSYSSVFPEGFLIGTVSSFEQPQGENYYIINVKLAVDFKSLSYVEVIDNLKKKEIKDLENRKIDDSVSN